jgi:hypothetical protein
VSREFELEPRRRWYVVVTCMLFLNLWVRVPPRPSLRVVGQTRPFIASPVPRRESRCRPRLRCAAD